MMKNSISGLRRLVPPLAKDLYRSYVARPMARRRYAHLTEGNSRLRGVLSSETLFIVGSGPSVAGLDLSLLRDRHVIFLNNMFVHRDYATACAGPGFKAQLFAPLHRPQADSEWVAWLRKMDQAISRSVKLIVGVMGGPCSAADMIRQGGLFQGVDTFYYAAYRHFTATDYFLTKEDIEPTKPILMAGAASVYALVYAGWLGARRVCLLGMDHNYILFSKESEMRVYDGAEHQKNEIERTFGDGFYEQEFLRQYHIFRQYRQIAMLANIGVVNCSMESLCRVFPKVPYEECIASSR